MLFMCGFGHLVDCSHTKLHAKVTESQEHKHFSRYTEHSYVEHVSMLSVDIETKLLAYAIKLRYTHTHTHTQTF